MQAREGHPLKLYECTSYRQTHHLEPSHESIILNLLTSEFNSYLTLVWTCQQLCRLSLRVLGLVNARFTLFSLSISINESWSTLAQTVVVELSPNK